MSKRRDTSDSLLTALSHIVRKRRESLKLSQEEVAHRAKLHRTYISDIERGARNLSLKSLVDLARALDLSASQLIISAEGRLSETGGDAPAIADPGAPAGLALSSQTH